MTWTHTGTVFFGGSGAATLTSGGKTLGAVTINGGSAQSVTLQDALSSSNVLTLTVGTFTTNNYNVTASSLFSSNSNTRTINLGSSTVTLSSSNVVVGFQTSTGLTFNAGTSQINLTSTTTPQILVGSTSGSGATFYNVAFTGAAATSYAVNGPSFTFNDLAFSAPATAGVAQAVFYGPATINGTLSTTGTAGNRRVQIRGVVYGIAQTLTINSAPSLTDADFRDIYVIGTAAPISGTRIGDLRGCRGITFSTPKTVYWNKAAGGQFSNSDAWATTSGGSVSADNFPLAQDTAIIQNTGLNTSATVSIDLPIPYFGSLDLSARTNAMTLNPSNAFTVYGNWTMGSGVAMIGNSIGSFSGRNTQTITSAGKTLSFPVTVDSYGGTVELADALNIGSNTLTVTNGTFDTKNYNVTAGSLSSANSNVRTITLGSSTVTLSGSATFTTATTTNLTFNAGTSQFNISNSSATVSGGTGAALGLTFYNLSFTSTSAGTPTLTGANTFNNLTVTAPASAGITSFIFSANQTINGTLTVAGATAVRRIFVRSDTLGTTRTLTVNSISADDCDFRDITIAGTAAGSSPTRAGDCGGNTGITFPAPKTVYWNLAGAQNWSATAWAPGSGGTPDINNFPLAQDTAVFDNTGSVTGTITINAAWNIGTFDASLRTSAMTLTTSTNAPFVYGDWKFGTGVTSSSTTGTITFAGRGTENITSNGVTFNGPVTIDCFTGTVQLADALTLTSARTLTLTSGTFDAVTYNVTTGLFTSGSVSTLKMGSSTWTLSGAGEVWSVPAGTSFIFYKGTADIVLSNTTTSARTFNGNGLSYNKLTIGGTTGTSTLTITGNNQFTELASTKTVAHTIALGTTTQTFGAWTVSGTVGNVVTVSGTATLTIAGARVSGVDYLAMGTTTVSATSPGEFYAGANSTGGTNAILTAAPASVTRYWVGGTGTWDATTTTKWSASSGGAGGASVPTSADAVIFNSASNATAYTVTCTATQLRCGSLTMAGPASGNVTWAGTAPLAIHDNVSLAATGITRTQTGTITLTGSSAGKTLTVNGKNSSASIVLNGVGCEWTLGSALGDQQASFTLINGSFSTAGYSWLPSNVQCTNANTKSLSLGASAVNLNSSATAWNFTNVVNLSFDAGTSTITDPSNKSSSGGFAGGGLTYNNVSFTDTSNVAIAFSGANTFNNLTIAGRTSAGITALEIRADQTINGTLTLSAGTNATMRTFVRSDTIGTTRTLTCAAFSGTDADFRDITIAGAAAPVSGTRLGDCKGNSGITFGAAKTVYWRGGTGGFGAANWSNTSGGSTNTIYFPLAQDTAIFNDANVTTGATATVSAAYNLGTLDMSGMISNTMTLATGSNTPSIYGNWINGTGTTLTGTGTLTFAGRGSQTITSAGVTFTQDFTIATPSGSVTLQDAFVTSRTLTLSSGTFNAAGYNATLGLGLSATGTNVRTLAIGSGTWASTGTSTTAWAAQTSTNLTVTGTGTISLTSASAKTFAGGGISYSGITLDQGGAGTLTISGNNTFANITNSYKATGATNITLGTTTQTVGNFTAAGEAGRVLTVQGSSASSPATLVLTAGTVTTPDYLTITGVRAYNLVDTWYAGANSTNNGSLGWIFATGLAPTSDIYYGATNVTQIFYGSTPVTAIYYGATQVF